MSEITMETLYDLVVGDKVTVTDTVKGVKIEGYVVRIGDGYGYDTIYVSFYQSLCLFNLKDGKLWYQDDGSFSIEVCEES